MKTVSEAAAALGRKGGSSRSPQKIAAARRNVARANQALSREQRQDRARRAAQARWSHAKPTTEK